MGAALINSYMVLLFLLVHFEIVRFGRSELVGVHQMIAFGGVQCPEVVVRLAQQSLHIPLPGILGSNFDILVTHGSPMM